MNWGKKILKTLLMVIGFVVFWIGAITFGTSLTVAQPPIIFESVLGFSSGLTNIGKFFMGLMIGGIGMGLYFGSDTIVKYISEKLQERMK